MRNAAAGRAAALATSHGGFLTSRQLREGRFDPDLARREVAAGRWQRPVRGFYVPSPEPIHDLTLARIGTAHGGATSRLTGLLAARALKLRWVPESKGREVLVPEDRRRRSTELVRVRRCAQLAALPELTWQGVLLAPPTRIVLDAGLALADLRDVRGVVLGAVADRRTTAAEVRTLLAGEPRNGTALVRRAVSDALDGAASPPEAELADGLRGCRQPFLLNPKLFLDGHFLGCPDGYFLGTGAGWEVDSRERHEGDDSFDDTLARHTVFGARGIVLAHPTPRRLRQDMAASAAAVLAVSAARLTLPPAFREPRGLVVVPTGPVLR